jgi:DNA-binding PadR family transcriptional regulator
MDQCTIRRFFLGLDSEGHEHNIDLGLSPGARFVAIALAAHWPNIYPSTQRLMKMTGYVDKETIYGHIDELEKAGYLTVIRNKGKNNTYTFKNIGLNQSGKTRLVVVRKNPTSSSPEKPDTKLLRKDKKKKEDTRQAAYILKSKTPKMEEEKKEMSGVKKSRQVDFEEVFASKLLSFGFERQAWGGKERGLIGRLIGIYGQELVGAAISWLFENWGELVANSRGKLRGAPSVAVLWSWREVAFAEVQNAQNGRRRPSSGRWFDEWQDDRGAVVGW